MQISESAESYAKERYVATVRKDGVLHIDHLRGVVTRLKSIGISDEEVLATGWLYEMINDMKSTFDEIDKRFGSRISVLVLSLSKDTSLPKGQIENQYLKQLKESSVEAKLVKLCDTSTSLKSLKNSALSKTRRIKYLKKELHYLSIIRPELLKAKVQYPGIQNIFNGINETISHYGQRKVVL